MADSSVEKTIDLRYFIDEDSYNYFIENISNRNKQEPNVFPGFLTGKAERHSGIYGSDNNGNRLPDDVFCFYRLSNSDNIVFNLFKYDLNNYDKEETGHLTDTTLIGAYAPLKYGYNDQEKFKKVLTYIKTNKTDLESIANRWFRDVNGNILNGGNYYETKSDVDYTGDNELKHWDLTTAETNMRNYIDGEAITFSPEVYSNWTFIGWRTIKSFSSHSKYQNDEHRSVFDIDLPLCAGQQTISKVGGSSALNLFGVWAPCIQISDNNNKIRPVLIQEGNSVIGYKYTIPQREDVIGYSASQNKIQIEKVFGNGNEVSISLYDIDKYFNNNDDAKNNGVITIYPISNNDEYTLNNEKNIFFKFNQQWTSVKSILDRLFSSKNFKTNDDFDGIKIIGKNYEGVQYKLKDGTLVAFGSNTYSKPKNDETITSDGGVYISDVFPENELPRWFKEDSNNYFRHRYVHVSSSLSNPTNNTTIIATEYNGAAKAVDSEGNITHNYGCLLHYYRNKITEARRVNWMIVIPSKSYYKL